jgi:3-hydroxyacyl-[acyl-carrier-protein] dehydratase
MTERVTTPMQLLTERGSVRADHPMLAGHFPGNPVVPGAWLLAWAVAAAERHLGATDARTVTGVKRVKFARPLAPGQVFECEFKTSADTLRFALTSNAAVVAEGALYLQARDG